MATENTTETPKIAKAKLGFTRQTARKVRRVADLVRNMTAGQAVTQLKFAPYKASTAIRKLIESAMANASNNLGIENPEDLKISQLLVDDGLTYKRWRAVSKGRAYSILKRSCQVNLALSDMSAAEYAKFVWETSPRNKKNNKKDKLTTSSASSDIKKEKV
jgi:large subunit ribosomal protein L22